MSHRNVINGIRMMGSFEFEGSIYYADIDDNLYLYDDKNCKIILVEDKELINKIWDALEAKPLDVVYGG